MGLLDVKHGQFTAVTGVTAIADVGFKPKAIIFYGAGTVDENRNTDEARFSLGFAIDPARGPSPAGLLQLMAASNGASGWVENATTVYWVRDYEGFSVMSMHIVSFDDDGFTVSVPPVRQLDHLVNYVALGGTAFSSVLKGFQFPSTTGVQHFDLGMKPKLLLALCGPQGGLGGCNLSVGAASASKQFVMAFAGAAAGARSLQRTNRLVCQISSAGGVDGEAEFLGFSDTGFYLNVISSPGADRQMVVLAFDASDEIVINLGTLTKPSDAAPVTQKISAEMQTKALLCFGQGHPGNNDGPQQPAQLGFGAYCAGAQMEVAAWAVQGATSRERKLTSTAVFRSDEITDAVPGSVLAKPTVVTWGGQIEPNTTIDATVDGGIITRLGSHPMADDPDPKITWSDFIHDPLPPGAIITGIHPTATITRKVIDGTNGLLGIVSCIVGGAHLYEAGAGTEFTETFEGDSIGTSLNDLAGKIATFENNATTNSQEYGDRSSVAEIGFQIRYILVPVSNAFATLENDGFSLLWNPNDVRAYEMGFMAIGLATGVTEPVEPPTPPVRGVAAIAPAWTDQLTEADEYLTDVLVPYELGAEQRMALREWPRTRLQFTLTTASADESALLEALLWAEGGNFIDMPFWPDAAPLAHDAAAGALLIETDTTQRRYIQGGRAIVWRDYRTAEIVQIADIAPDGLTLATALAGSWAADGATYVMPILTGLLSDQQQMGRETSITGALEVDFISVPIPAVGDEWATQYCGMHVLDTEPNRANGMESSFQRLRHQLDPKAGTPWVYDRARKPIVGRAVSLLLADRAEIWKHRGFLKARLGSAVPFWLPSWNRDLQLVGPHAPGAPAIVVADANYTARHFPSNARRHLLIVTASGAQYYRKVTAAAAAAGVETLELSAPVPAALDASTHISFLTLCRLADDFATLRWHSHDVAELEINAMEVPGEAP